MSNNVIPIGQAQRPAKLRERLQAGVAVNRNFADGVRDSFPSLSIKGKVFRIRRDGQETPLIDQQTRQVIPYLDVVMLNASPLLAKAYYIKGFTDDENSFQAPDCWSLDSVRPDPSVANKVSPTCANCPMNQFGSAPSRDASAGRRGGKACSDSRRVAVVMPGHLGDANSEPMVFLLKVPATSLKNLKGYAQLLERQGWEPAACVTRLSFDYNEAYPKLVFNFVDGLDDADYVRGVQIAESPTVASMLSSPDFDTVASPATPTPNEKLEPRVVQQAPILETPLTPAGEAALWQAAPPHANVQPGTPMSQPIHEHTHEPQGPAHNHQALIELPDGKLFNPMTGEYIDRVIPEQPKQDPATLPLPDGRFYNTTTRTYVTGPEVGAQPVSEAPVKAKPAAKKVPPKKVEPVAQAAPQPEKETSVDNPPAAEAPATTSGVLPSSAELDSVLNTILPKR